MGDAMVLPSGEKATAAIRPAAGFCGGAALAAVGGNSGRTNNGMSMRVDRNSDAAFILGSFLGNTPVLLRVRHSAFSRAKPGMVTSLSYS